MVKQPCTYILASGHYGTLYIGVTADLLTRLYQHRGGDVKAFTTRYTVFRLVRYEFFRRHADCDRAGEAAQALAPRLEDQPDQVR